jgi:hypothetical protein
MKAQPVTISLHDVSRGFEVSPERVPLAVLSDFARDVEELLRGDGKQLDTGNLEVAVVKGSLAVQTQPISATDFAQDLAKLLQSQLIDSLHAKRREVIARWQKLAKSHRSISFKITSAWLTSDIIINADTDFRSDDADQWVRVERYLRGEIYDLGGKQVVNAHMLLPDGKTIKVEAARETIRADKLNRLYKPAMVRIKAEYNVLTREYRNAQLLEFVEHDSKLDVQAMARLTGRGAEAWKDVPSASKWVDDLRGGLV